MQHATERVERPGEAKRRWTEKSTAPTDARGEGGSQGAGVCGLLEPAALCNPLMYSIHRNPSGLRNTVHGTERT